MPKTKKARRELERERLHERKQTMIKRQIAVDPGEEMILEREKCWQYLTNAEKIKQLARCNKDQGDPRRTWETLIECAKTRVVIENFKRGIKR